MLTKIHSLKGLAAFALMATGLVPAAHAATAGGGDLILGFRAMAGTTGVTTNYVVKVDTAAALRDGASVRAITLSGVAADLAALYGAGWHDRTDLTWGVVANTDNFSTLNGDPAQTLYASRAEPVNGVLATPWNRNGPSTQSFTTNLVSGFLSSGFNTGTAATNAPSIANSMPRGASNSWSQYLPAAGPPPETYGAFSGGISFQTWDGTGIEAIPASYQDLFRMVPSATAAPAALVGRLVLDSSANLLFIPAAQLGVNSVQFSTATYSAAEDDVGGTLDVTVTRTGDTSTSTSVTISTTTGSATAGTDYDALTSQAVSFLAGETSKVVHITIHDLAGDQGTRSFGVALGGNTGGTTIGSQGTATCSITEAPSTLQLSATSYSAHQEDSTVNVTIQRTAGSAAVTVQISTVNSTAVAGTDFTAITNQTVNIPANINLVNVPITLSHPMGSQANKKFTVTLSNPGSGASLDSDTSLLISTVNIFATDTLAPTLAITAPAANAIITGTVGGVVVVAGTASDDKGIAKLEVSVDNGATWKNASLAVGNWNTASSGANSIKPAGGLTTIIAKATDNRNNVTTVTRTFTYKITTLATALTVNVVDVGGAGSKVTGKLVAPAVYEVGKTYTLTAMPGANRAFDHWTVAGASVAPAADIAKLSFVFTQALVSNPVITATFVANPFLAANNVTGSYTGLIKAHTGTVASNSTNGCVTVTVTTLTGAFTGTVKIDGSELGAKIIVGSFDNAGNAEFGTTHSSTVSVPRTNKAPYLLAMTLNTTNKQITGTLKETSRTGFSAQSDFIADRAAYSATAPVAANLLNKVAGTTGYYTAVLPARAAATASLPGLVLANNEFPQGDGYTSMTVSKSGDVTFAGVLGDGTTLTATGKLTAANHVILFSQLYTAKGGSIGGEIAVTRPTTFVEVAGTNFFWFRPYQAVQYYPYGWPEGLLTDLTGSEYNVVAGSSVFPGLTGTSPNTNVQFADGLLNPSPLSKDFNISTTNAVTLTGTTLGVVVAPATGIIGGAATTFFTHTDGTKVPFKAMIVQKGTSAGGWGYFLTTAPKVIDGLGESGGVSLMHK